MSELERLTPTDEPPAKPRLDSLIANTSIATSLILSMIDERGLLKPVVA